jgi:hypothetical protein
MPTKPSQAAIEAAEDIESGARFKCEGYPDTPERFRTRAARIIQQTVVAPLEKKLEEAEEYRKEAGDILLGSLCACRSAVLEEAAFALDKRAVALGFEETIDIHGYAIAMNILLEEAKKLRSMREER